MNHAILTGDIVNSTKLSENERIKLINQLKNLSQIDKKIDLKIEIYRGDGFQVEVKKVEEALRYAILLRAFFKGKIHFKNKENEYDARIAIGIGNDFQSMLNYMILGERNGEAFRNSGQLLDEMKKKQNLIAISTSNEILNEDLDIYLCLLEEIISNWKPLQADVIFYKILGYTEISIAEKLNISQSAINQTAKAAGWLVVEKLLNYYEKNINSKLKG